MAKVDAREGAWPELLTNDRRRRVVECLEGRDAGMALADLATDVAALERERSAREVSPEAVERVYLSLYHCHVPKLADNGVVEHRTDRNVVSLASGSERVRAIEADVSVRRRA